MRLLLFCYLTVIVTSIKVQEQALLESQTNMGTALLNFIEQNPLGKMMFSFAQIEMHASGAVDVLMEVLKAFGRQQESRLAEESEIWQTTLGDHNARRIQFEALVNEAEIAINKDRKRLNSELVPRSMELDEVLISLKTKKELNEKAKKNAVALREEQLAQFNLQANEITEAIRATDEALEYIKRCGVKASSFLEEQEGFQMKLQKIKKSAEHSTEYMGSMIHALSQVSESQNFADKQVQKQLVDLLNSLRGYFVETLQKAYADEDQQKLLHTQRMEQLDTEQGVFEKQYGDAFQEREQKSLQIDDANKLILTRGKEHQSYLDRLTTENNNFSQNMKIHDDLVASVNSEIGFIEKALNVLQNPSFAEELQNAINKAK